MILFGRMQRLVGLAAAALALCCADVSARRPDGELELSVVEEATGQPIAARIHLRDGRNKPVPQERGVAAWGLAPLGDHAYIDGKALLGMKRGVYRFDLDAGPEFRTQHGHFEIVRHADDTKEIPTPRFVKLAEEGWSAADLATCRPAADLPLLHRAEQLAYTPTIAATWKDGEWAEPDLAERRRRDKESPGASALWDDARGVVWLIDPDESRTLEELPKPGKSSVDFLSEAQEGGWRVVASITSRELPLWIAHDVVDAVVVIDGWAESPAGEEAAKRGRQPDELRYPGKQGPGRWRRTLYESLIDAGVRVPAVAMTGSGLNTTPIGASRVYAHTDGDDSPAAWWDAADGLATVVTNGPLLRPFVEGSPPGETFLLGADGKRTVSIALNLATRTKIDYLEIVKNGATIRSVRIADLAAAKGKLPDVEFDAPGWLSIVAVAESPDRYEMAMSAPWFIEGPDGGRADGEARMQWRKALQEAAAEFGESDLDAYAKAESFWAPQGNDQ
jgi:hypothetical protein